MHLGLGLSDEMSVDEAVKYVKMAEKNGFESVWMPEDYYYRDAVTMLSVLATATNNVKLATGVINPNTRSPPLIAMTTASLNEISNGRVILGLGPSMRLWLYELHRERINQVTAMKECIEIVRALLAGERIVYDGRLFKIHNVKLGLHNVGRNIPIYLGVMGPKMLHLTGQMADGVLLTACATPAYVKYAIENIKRGAESAGKDHSRVDVAGYIMISMSDDPEEAKEVVKKKIAYMVTLPQFNFILELSDLTDKASVARIREAGGKGRLDEAATYVDDELIDALSVTGTVSDCRKKLGRFIEAGITTPVLLPLGKFENYKTIIKSFKL